jgi:pyruvate formate lyase activating enzyme
MEARFAMQGILFDIKKYALHDGPGIRTTCFFKGCPLDCAWCHNPESRNVGVEERQVKDRRNNGAIRTATVGRRWAADELMKEIVKDRVFYDQSGGGATFSGGEPLFQVAFLKEMLTHCRRQSIHTAVDTSGAVEYDAFEQVCGLTDLFLYDIKVVDPERHRELTTRDNEQILDNLKRLSRSGANIWLRLPVIPGITDDNDNLDAVGRLLGDVKTITTISLLPYNKMREDKCDRFNVVSRLTPLTTPDTKRMTELASPFVDLGYDVRIGG